MTGNRIQKSSRAASGLKLELQSGETLEAEKVLIATGRRPTTRDLGLERAGIRIEKNGTIPVNDYLETPAPGVYAVGDVINSPQLAHVASYEGTLVVENLRAKTKQRADYRAIPNCVYSDPEVASVGLSGELRDRADVLEVKIPFASIGKAQAESETEGFFKLIASAGEGRILGARAIGAHVTELLPEIGLAIRLNLTVYDLLGNVHAHPTASEIIAIAARELSRRVRP